MTRAKRERLGGKSGSGGSPKRTTRMAFVQNNRGSVQLDVVSEYESPETSAMNARRAIQLFKEICEEEGLRLANKPF
mgnify:FL=1